MRLFSLFLISFMSLNVFIAIGIFFAKVICDVQHVQY